MPKGRRTKKKIFSNNRHTLKQNTTEAYKRIKEAIESDDEFLDLSELNLSKNDIIIPEHPSGQWFVILLDNNNLTSIPENIPSVFTLSLTENKITHISKKILNRLGKDIDSIFISGNPVAKKYFPYRQVNSKNIITNTNIDYIIIPKGTVLFRSLRKDDDLKKMYIGYNPENNNDVFVLHPDHQNYFYLSPFNLNTKLYGPIRSLFVLTEDVKVFLALNPSKINKRDMYDKYFEKCPIMSIN